MHINSLETKLRNAIRIDRALKFVWQASPLYSIISGLIVLVLAILPLIFLYLLKLIIDSITSLELSPETGIFDSQFSLPLTYIAMALGIGLLTAFFNHLSSYLKKAQSLTVSDYMFSIIHEKSVLADLSFYESSKYRDTLFRAQTEGPYRPTSIVSGLFAACQSGASFIAVVWLLFIFNPIFPLIMILAVIPGILMRLNYSGKIYSWQEKRTEDERRCYYFHYMLTGDAHAKEFRLFNLGNHFIGLFRNLRERLKIEKLWFEKRRTLGDFIAQSSATLAVFGSFAFIGLKTGQGVITLGDMMMYFQAFQRGLGYLKGLLESGAQMYEDNLFLSQLYEFLNIEPEIKSPSRPIALPAQINKGIEFKNVTFSYQSSIKNVINNVNFSIKPGETIALVGENGSGKSTIVKLLARLYDQKSGSIFFDGIDIRQFDPVDYRKKISVVFQDHVQYQLSAGENISLGDVEQLHDQKKIHHTALKAELYEKINSYPDGFDTILGNWFRNGKELSAGQWHMLAIARAFFREADIVIFDEPSSDLDPKMELSIFNKLNSLMDDKIALIISHRYSTVKMADRILVLDNGEIVEQGTHAQLTEMNGKYSELYRAQADNYV